MGTTIVIVIAVVIVIGVFATLITMRLDLARAAKRSRQERRARTESTSEARPVWTDALVLDSRVTGSAGAKQTVVALTLKVSPPGGAPYQASVTWLVDADALHLASPGGRIPVRLDAADPKKISPAVVWAAYSPRSGSAK